MSDHLTEAQINDLADSRLSPDTLQTALGHLDTCEECRMATHRVTSVIAAAAELKRPVVPARDLWPAVSHRTVQQRSIRGPWLFTLILSVVVIAVTSLWLERTRPWERISTQVVTEPEYRASDAEITRLLRGLAGNVSDATKRRELDRIAPAVFRSSNPVVLSQFFQTVTGIQSDGEKRELLLLLQPYATDVPVTRGFLEAARSIQSSNQKAEVLAAVAGAPSMTNSVLRLLYLDAAESITSERDRAHARSALLTCDGRADCRRMK